MSLTHSAKAYVSDTVKEKLYDKSVVNFSLCFVHWLVMFYDLFPPIPNEVLWTPVTSNKFLYSIYSWTTL